MPSFIKEELPKKDGERLKEMQREIDEAHAEPEPEPEEAKPNAEAQPAAEEAGDEAADTDVETEDESENTVETEVETEAEQLKKAAAALAESESSLKRLRADFENFRRRTAKEKEEVGAVAAQEIIRDMLPLLDNFERALATEDKGSEKFRQGVEMIYNQFLSALKKHGLVPIKTEGEKFDPNFHQAVMRVENPDMEDDTIAAELQKGYMVKDKVIRPSMVQVVGN